MLLIPVYQQHKYKASPSVSEIWKASPKSGSAYILCYTADCNKRHISKNESRLRKDLIEASGEAKPEDLRL